MLEWWQYQSKQKEKKRRLRGKAVEHVWKADEISDFQWRVSSDERVRCVQRQVAHSDTHYKARDGKRVAREKKDLQKKRKKYVFKIIYW